MCLGVESVDESFINEDDVSVFVLLSSLHGYESCKVLDSNVSFSVPIDIFDGEIDVSEIPMLPLFEHLLFPVYFCSFIGVYQTMDEFVVRFGD